MSASETPALCTESVKVWLEPPAVAVSLLNVFVTLSCDVLDDVDRVAARRRAVLVGGRRCAVLLTLARAVRVRRRRGR